jgi:hypothetical protein
MILSQFGPVRPAGQTFGPVGFGVGPVVVPPPPIFRHRGQRPKVPGRHWRVCCVDVDASPGLVPEAPPVWLSLRGGRQRG